ncbi:MAG: TGS domain-containing protein [Rhodospirillaceae bacterium]|nr:TGS domain-containing protein [Rhodospirillaceae bacterium]
MPANLSPDYKKAEQAFRDARDEQQRLMCLKEMLRTIPKHKGTEHLQADIKSRIKQLSEALAGPRKGASRSGPVHSVRPEGAAQIALLGPPNSGKSSLHVKLTGSRADVGPYPHTTREPMPGMLNFEDVSFQLIDLPPISAQWIEPWFVNALQPADGAVLVVDIADPECTDHVEAILARLEEKKITLTERWPGLHADTAVSEAQALDPFRIHLPTLLVANKLDLDPDPEGVEVLKELLDVRFPTLATSAVSGAGLDRVGRMLFDGLEIVRVYTKTPGRAPEMDRPFTVRRGATVLDVARLVHKDIAGSLKYARAWGAEVFDGQQVGPEHPLADADVVELHMR